MTKEKKDQYPNRIPFDNWIHSQLSIAKYYGSIIINGDTYNLDYDNCKKGTNEDGKEVYFPDLVKEKTTRKKAND